MKQRKPDLNKDKKLEQLVVGIQCSLSKVKSILNDYIYLDSPGTHLCLVKRNRIRFYNALQKEVTILKSQIDEFETNLCKKKYTENHLATKVFDIAISEKDYFVCNIQVINLSLCRVFEEIMKNKDCKLFKRNDYAIGRCIFMYEMLFDISRFFDLYYQTMQRIYKEYLDEGTIKSEDVLFAEKYRQRMMKNNVYTSNDVLRAAQQVMYKYLYKDDNATIPIVIFQLRQIIELRLLEIFGVRAFITDDGVLEKKTANVLLDIDGLDDNVIMPISKGTLKKIYAWTCCYVHRGIAGAYWLIEFLYLYMLDFTIENSVIRVHYMADIKHRISTKTGIPENNIILDKNCAADLVDDIEFEKIKQLVTKKGFKDYLGEKKQKELDFLMEIENRREKWL